MKSALALASSFLLIAAVHGSAFLETRADGGNYVQNPSGNASFSAYSNCSVPACGKPATSGFTASMSQLSFGAPQGQGHGDACGRCFNVTAASDPNTPDSKGPFKSIVVKVNDLCSAQDDQQHCGQTASDPNNSLGQPVHFQMCQDSGAPGEFFPSGSDVMIGSYEEVPCSSNWTGSDGPSVSDDACLAPNGTSMWPSQGCGNQGSPPS